MSVEDQVLLPVSIVDELGSLFPVILEEINMRKPFNQLDEEVQSARKQKLIILAQVINSIRGKP